MRQRVRKFVGTIVLVVFVALYALVVMAIASAKLPGSPVWFELAFFVVAGLIWVVPAGALVVWMQKPDGSAL
jgi:hypothetical protein